MSVQVALQLIERCSRYVEPPPIGLTHYEFWVASEEELTPAIRESLRTVAQRLLSSASGAVLRSAVQALACTGTPAELEALERLKHQADPGLAPEVEAAIQQVKLRGKPLETLLGEVDDEASFMLFARALAAERERAAKIERTDPQRYALDGALDWKNADIASFIYAGLSAFEGRGGASAPRWEDFAVFLYRGKIIE